MDYQAKYITEDIKLSCYEDQFFKSDILFDHHMLVWFISGETKIVQADQTYVFKKGDLFLIPRNQLATIINYPKDGQPHQTVVMHLSTARLRVYFEPLGIGTTGKPSDAIRHFENHPLLTSCMASLVPYFDMATLPENIADLKIAEAISIIRTIDPSVDALLTNYELPGKIDLVAYMERHFMFNLPLERFGYLTGRSLTTFKRDFKKAFAETSQRWLTRKRLELAHYKLREGGSRPIYVCYETGFEDLSHFSFAFKKRFGYGPRGVGG